MKNLFYEITSNRLNLLILVLLSLLLPYISVQAYFLEPVGENAMAVSSHFMGGNTIPNEMVNKTVNNDTEKLDHIRVNYSLIKSNMEKGNLKAYSLLYLLAAMVAQIFFAAPVLYGYISYEYAYGRKVYRPLIQRYALSFLTLILFSLPLNLIIAVHSYYVWPGTCLWMEFLKYTIYSIPLLLLSLSLLSLVSLSTGSGGATVLTGFGFVILSLWKKEFQNALVSYTLYFWIALVVSTLLLIYLWRWKNA